MKKAFVAVFGVVCAVSSIMAGSGSNGKVANVKMENRMLRDTIPGKTDTSRYPKHDTTNLPRFDDGQVK